MFTKKEETGFWRYQNLVGNVLNIIRYTYT